MTTSDPAGQAREQMHAAVRRAASGPGRLRKATGISLVALLCAGALTPVAVAGVTLAPVMLAAVGLAGGVGVNVLTDVISKALDRLGDGEDVEPVLAELFTHALTDPGPEGVALREAAGRLLRELDVPRLVVEQIAASQERTRTEVLAGLAELCARYAEFTFLTEDVLFATWRIEQEIEQQRAEIRAAAEQASQDSRTLAQIRDSLRDGRDLAINGGAWQGCPYLGLQPFSQRHARVFYGRGEMTVRLRQSLAGRFTESGLLLMTGPSGAGKSSLLRAGLVPSLSRYEIAPGSDRWPCRVLTPTGSPLRELAVHLAALSGQDPSTVLAAVTLEPRCAAGIVSERLILVIDQFEELFTLAARDQDAFVEALDALATASTLVVVSVRGDFLDQALAYPALASAQERGVFVVQSMTPAELRQAITGPAAEAGLDVEPGLVDEVVREARNRPGALPLVSQVMAATWEHREDGRLTLAGYRRAGGLADAVHISAQDAYQELGARQQAAARRVFLKLVLVKRDGQTARRPCDRAELYQAVPADAVDAVLEAFVARRLLVLERGTVSIAHDVLLTAWRELHGWLDADRAGLAQYGQVLEDAEAWDAHNRQAAYLYRPGRVAEIDRAAKRWSEDPTRYPPLPPSAAAFLAAGGAAARRAGLVRRWVAVALVVFAVVAGMAAVAARDDAATAHAQGAIALSRQLAAQSLAIDQSDPVVARQLAATAWAESPTSQASSAIQTLLAEQETDSMLIASRDFSANAVAFNARGTLLATTGEDDTVRLWNPGTEREIGAPIPALAQSVAFSPDGAMLATVDGLGTAQLWNTTTGKEIGKPLTSGTPARSQAGVAFNPAGTLLAAADATGSVRLWNPATGHQTSPPLRAASVDHGVTAVAFSPDGAILATAASDGTVQLWNPGTGHRIGTPLTADSDANPVYGVTGLAFNLAGTVLATGADDGTVRFFDPRSGRELGNPIAAGTSLDRVTSVAFSPVGTVLASAEGNGTVRLWNYVTGRAIGEPIVVSEHTVNAVAFSPNDAVLATAADDGTVRLWNPATGQSADSPVTSAPFGQEVNAIALNSRGTALAVANSAGTVQLWNPAARREYATFTASSEGVLDLAFNPAGTLLATTGGDGIVRLWNPVTGRQVGKPIVASPGEPVNAVAFNHAGTMLATADGDGTARLWSLATGKQIGKPLAAANPRYMADGVAFSPADTILVTSAYDSPVRLWNPATGQQIRSPITASEDTFDQSALTFNQAGTLLAIAGLSGLQLWDPTTGRLVKTLAAIGGTDPGVWSVAFNPRGTLLATYVDGGIQLWNPATGRKIGFLIPTGTNGVEEQGLAFSPDGTTLTSTISNGRIQTWQPALWADPYRTLCAEAGPLSSFDWRTYAQGTTQPPACTS